MYRPPMARVLSIRTVLFFPPRQMLRKLSSDKCRLFSASTDTDRVQSLVMCPVLEAARTDGSDWNSSKRINTAANRFFLPIFPRPSPKTPFHQYITLFRQPQHHGGFLSKKFVQYGRIGAHSASYASRTVLTPTTWMSCRGERVFTL